MGIDSEEEIISTDKMLEYFEKFDAIKFKYGYSDDKEIQQDWNRYTEIVKYEESNQYAFLTKKNYVDFYENLNLVYDEKNLNQKSLQLLELVLDKVICQYINIAGIERLFRETYIEFEWEMHLSADYKKHNMNFYRDHFSHQIRNAYMMLRLMEKHGFYEHIKKVLENASESKVSRFVHRSLEQQSYSINKKIAKLREKEREDNIGFSARNLIYMASIMAALFHDIGYPEAYFMQTNRHIMDYIANLHELNSGNGNIREIYSLLQNSLLFRVVSFEEIEKRICNVEKPDHGVLSAVVFLLHFYENGAIHKLAPYKTAAVELAALAIYNHTNNYEISGKKDQNCDMYRPSFSLNPISYLLRICDDLQEWDRIYFVISNKSNPVFCNKCKTPILGKREEVKDSGVDGTKVKYVRYRCNCCDKNAGKEKDLFSRIFDGESGFSYRRIYNVSVCDRLVISRCRTNEDHESKEKLFIKLHYDLYKLLHIAYLDHTYAKYRIKELNSVKKFFTNQKEIPQIYLDYFVTSNPIHIKVEILEKYLGNASERGKKYMEILEKGEYSENVFSRCEQEIFAECRGIINNKFLDKKIYSEKCYGRMLKYLENALRFYIKLYLCQIISKVNNINYKKDIEDFIKRQGRSLSERFKSYPELQCLTEDCFLQFSRMFEFVPDMELYPDYYKQYNNGKRKKYLYPESEYLSSIESEDYYYVALERYMDTQTYEPLLHRKEEEYIDAYTDLYLFYLMNCGMEKREK